MAETEKVTQITELTAGREVTGTIKKLELYGAFVDIGVGQDALLHISQLGKNVRNIEDAVKVGDSITAFILKVQEDTKRIALTLTKPSALPWEDIKIGDTYKGEIVRIENFGAFVEIGAERPGMVHVSELASGFVKSPSDVVKVGDQVEVRVIKLNRKKKQIDLSMKSAPEVVEVVREPEEEVETAMSLALKRAMSRDDADTNAAKKAKQLKRNQEQDDLLSRTLKQHISN